MDTSPEYINMCRKAKELQETWEPKEGDWIFIQRAGDSRGYEKAIGGFNLNSGYYFYGGGDSVAIRAATDDVVWLPRLDQLIEMSGYDWKTFNSAARDSSMNAMRQALHENKEYPPESYETIGLITVMRIVYDKIWNDEDWIKQ